MPPKTVCGNPLLAGWIKEELDKHIERVSKGANTYKKAYKSLLACPITFDHPSEAVALDGVGEKMCKMLTKKMEEHCSENGLPMPTKIKKKGKRKSTEDGDNDQDEENDAPAPTKKSRKGPKAYIPTFRSGAYALIVGLATLREGYADGYNKTELQDIAQEFCDASFEAPVNEGSFYTAWNSMKTLQNKELVATKKRGLNTIYNLTDEGWELAKNLKQAVDPGAGPNATFNARPADSANEDSFQDLESNALPTENIPPVPDIIPQGRSTDALPSFEPIVLQPGSFTVQLVLDNREIRTRKDTNYMSNQMILLGHTPITRSLELGDITWVAKLHSPALLASKGGEGDEVLLDYIVERKRLDDLVSSIKDGRFSEQKFRLSKSGVKNKIYIIEEFSGDFSNYETHIATAIASTQVVNKCHIKKTQRMDETIRYLLDLTNLLKQKYESRPLYLIPSKHITRINYLPLLEHLGKINPSIDYHITYSAFASMSSKSKTLTLRDVYVRMLMCTRGLTAEKAMQIQRKWETPKSFIDAYKSIDMEAGGEEQGKKRKGELVSKEFEGLISRKKIGSTLSKKVAEIWGEAA